MNRAGSGVKFLYPVFFLSAEQVTMDSRYYTRDASGHSENRLYGEETALFPVRTKTPGNGKTS